MFGIPVLGRQRRTDPLGFQINETRANERPCLECRPCAVCRGEERHVYEKTRKLTLCLRVD